MGKWIHRLLEVDLTEMTGICSHCGPTKLKRNKHATKGATCLVSYKNNQSRNGLARGAMKNYMSECERCGFIPECPSQIEIHHIDRDPQNNEMINLMAVCANCHRFIHYH